MDTNRSKIELNFSVGDYVDTNVNGHAFIVDILRSETSNRVIICAEFTYNFPNPRKFDMIVVEPGRMAGVDKWEKHELAKGEFRDELLLKLDSLKKATKERTDELENFYLSWWWCGDEVCDCHQPIIYNGDDIVDKGLVASSPDNESWLQLEESAKELCEKYQIEYVLSPRQERFKPAKWYKSASLIKT